MIISGFREGSSLQLVHSVTHVSGSDIWFVGAGDGNRIIRAD